MRRYCFFFILFFYAVTTLGFVPSADAAKKKDKVVPTKIIKASETKFQHAKILDKKRVKKKRFLWFKKKEPKLKRAEIVRMAEELRVRTPDQSPIKATKSKLDSKKVSKKKAKKLEVPEVVTPEANE